MARNLISANGLNGVDIEGKAAINNRLLGNFIGADLTGMIINPDGVPANGDELGNGLNGVHVGNQANNNLIGDAAGGGNVISGNGNSGIELDISAQNNPVRGNFIGTDPTSTSDLGNNLHGIAVFGKNNIIGGPGAGAPNIIAFNGTTRQFHGHGVIVESGTGNAIRRNSIFSNRGRGIHLGAPLDPFLLNELGEDVTGPNHLQDYPVVTKVQFQEANKMITWTLNSTPNTAFTIDFFANSEPDSSGFGEGKNFIREVTVMTNAQGNVTFTETFTAAAVYYL